MDLTTAKIISMLTLGLGSFVAGILPSCFSERARQKHPLVLSCLLCFGGGVLLSTSIVHMLPEAREKLPQNSEVMFCVGFFLVYLVDELFHLFYGDTQRGGSHANYGTGEGTSLLASRERDGELREKCCGDAENSRMCHVSHTPPCNKSSTGIVGLLCALFIHSLLEGLAIGLQDKSSQVLLLLAAVSSHKFVVGFCLGAELCDSFPGCVKAHIGSISLFSGGSVAGIAIGAGLETVNAWKDSIALPIMQALAAGTLLYVTVSEVLPRERARWHERRRSAGIVQFIAFAVGFTIMFLTTKYLDHDNLEMV